MIRSGGGDEFLVARFPGAAFAVNSDTGIEPMLSLHLAAAKLVIGRRPAERVLATSPTPGIGGFTTWLAGYPLIVNPAMKLPSADADMDGRSNLLEYATGGDPSSPDDPAPCWISPDSQDGFWVGFRHVPGLGLVRYTLETTADPGGAWFGFAGLVEPDPEDAGVLRARVSPPMSPSGFFRLSVEYAP